MHIGTYLCSATCPREDGSNQHYYHHLTVNPDAWLHVLLDKHPQHRRGEAGADDPGNDPAADQAGLGSYYQYMNRLYVEFTFAQPTPTAYWIDEIELGRASQPENDISIASLWTGYWPAGDYWELGFNDGSFALNYGNSSHSTFKVRYSTQPITGTNFSQATLVTPMFNESGSGRIRRPNPWQKPAWTRFRLPANVQQNGVVYFAIKDVSAVVKGDGHNAPSSLVKTIDYTLRAGLGAPSNFRIIR